MINFISKNKKMLKKYKIVWKILTKKLHFQIHNNKNNLKILIIYK